MAKHRQKPRRRAKHAITSARAALDPNIQLRIRAECAALSDEDLAGYFFAAVDRLRESKKGSGRRFALGVMQIVGEEHHRRVLRREIDLTTPLPEMGEEDLAWYTLTASAIIADLSVNRETRLLARGWHAAGIAEIDRRLDASEKTEGEKRGDLSVLLDEDKERYASVFSLYEPTAG